MQIQSDKTDSEQTSHRGFSAETLNTVVQTLAIIVAGLWAIYTFVYQAKIVPSLAPPTFSVTRSLEKVSVKGSQIPARSTVTRSNVGHAGVRL